MKNHYSAKIKIHFTVDRQLWRILSNKVYFTLDRTNTGENSEWKINHLKFAHCVGLLNFCKLLK